MALPTTHLRQVFRTVNDGNGDVKVLAVQRWYSKEGYEHPSVCTEFNDDLGEYGYWADLEIAREG